MVYKNDVLTTTEKGTYLDADQFRRFFNNFGDIRQCLPESAVEMLFFLRENHNSQFGALLCKDSNPFYYLICVQSNLYTMI